MAITRVQQTQISGSLSYDDSLAAGSGLAGKSSLVGDLNALRSQLNKVIGKSNWFDALDGSQDLADIYGAIHVSGADAAVQGDLSAVDGSFSGALAVTGEATFSAGISGSAGLKLAGDLDVNSSADIQGALNLQSTLTVAGASDLNGALDVSGQVDLGGMMSATSVRGAFSVAGASTLHAAVVSGSLKIEGDVAGRVYVVGADGEITDSMGLTYSAGALSVNGSATVSNGLTVNGAVADFNADVTANKISIDSDVAGRLYMVGSSGEIMDQAQLTFDMGSLAVKSSMGNAVKFSVDSSTGNVVAAGSLIVTGSAELKSTLAVDGLATLAAGLTVNGAAADFNADVTANKISIDGDVAQRLYIVDADGSIKDESKLTFDGSELAVDGALDIGGGDFTVSAAGAVYAASTLEVDGAAQLDSTLAVAGAATLSSTLGVTGAATFASTVDIDGAVDMDSTLNVQGNAVFQADVQIDGDLRVKGSMTYIDTANMRVQDAFIYLATGSAGSTDSGIVLHGGAGAGMDLVIGQDGGAGEVIFGKMDRSPDGDGEMDGIALVAAWSSAIKLGSAEGSLSGSLAAVAGGIELKAEAGKSLSVEAATDLTLKANGFEMGLGSSAQYTTFDSNFSATTIVGALNELYAAGAGGSKKGNLSVADVSAGVLTFSSIGTLGSAAQQFVDVYLNGVLLAYGKDLSSITTTSIAIDGGIASALTADDCLTVVLRGAA